MARNNFRTIVRNNHLLSAIVIAFLAPACGQTTQQDSAKLSALHRKTIPLTSGEYLIKIESPEECTPGEFSVSQDWQYPDPNVAKNPVVELSLNQRTTDNWMRTLVCQTGNNFGWTVLKVDGDAQIASSYGRTEIASVDMIETKAVTTSSQRVTLQPNSEYIVDAVIEGKCRNQQVTLNGHYEYAAASGSPDALDKKVFTSFTANTDDLFHRAICKTPAVYTASEYVVSSAKNQLLVTSAGDIQSFQKLNVRAVVSRKKVPVSPGETSDETAAIEITGADGDRLMVALEDLGVQDTEPMYGAKNLTVTNLRCDKNTADATRKIRCTYSTVNPDTRATESHTGIEGKASDEIFDVLMSHDAAIPAGINPKYQAVGARKVLCSRPVVPNPVATCRVTRL